ncbi:MAG: DUF6240 domain-containing protein [Lachnospiraceae bacterium]|nr:DUF6240 domain-containing protein [Lachnospiraceae bacterium]
MKISFDNYSRAEFEHAKESYNTYRQSEISGASAGFLISPSLQNNMEYETGSKTIADIQNDTKAKSALNTTNEQIVLAHTLSKEEYKEYSKDGNLKDVNLSDSETILDHIKMELVKAGVEIKGYTDDLDPELKKEISHAIDKAKELTEMTEGMKNYFVSTGKSLTIDNLYLAKFSAGNAVEKSGAGYFTTEAHGYFAMKASFADNADLKQQVTELLTKEGGIFEGGFSGNNEIEENIVEDAMWLVKNSFVVDEAHLSKLKEVESLALPLTQEKMDKAIEIALVEGKNLKDVDLLRNENKYEQALRITEDILNLSEGELRATRVMEEVRLKMTTEANLKLIESGFSIDTKNLETYVEALTALEKTPEYQEVKAINEVKETVNEIADAPVALIGRMMTVIPDADLLTLRAEGNNLKKTYETAGIEYEKMYTEVRKDLGDSIKKAFRNVDELLKDTGLEINETNRRAVRVLGYNSMEITRENVEKVSGLDTKLTHIIKSIAPEDTLNLIRKGTSPVNMTISELEEYVEAKETADEARMERYSKFLYKLERSENIEKDERQQFIEVYRVLHQLEKTDYAAIGGLLKTGRELSFANLKNEMKSAKNIGMNVKVDSSFGFLVRELESSLEPMVMKASGMGENTTLNQAFDLMNREDNEFAEAEENIEKQYQNSQYKEFKAGLEASSNTVEELIAHSEPVTVSNLLAANQLINRKNAAFKKVDDIRGKEFREEINEVKENFAEKEEAYEKYESLMENSKEAVFEEAMNSEKYIDVRELMLTHKQLTVAASLAKNETYNVPLEVAGEMTDVALKIVHNENEEPNVSVMFQNDYFGKVSAKFTVNDGKISGYIACNYKDTVTELKKTADILGEGVTVVYSREADLSAFNRIPMKDNSEEVSTVQLYKVAKTFLESLGE